MSGSMSGMWKRSNGPGYLGTANRKGRQQHPEPTATAPHLDSTQ